jgi:hypothetical protein
MASTVNREANVAANPERGEVDVEIGGETRTLRFQTAEMLLLEKQLEKDPLQFVASGGGQSTFLVNAIFAGLSRGGTNKKMTPIRVAGWLDAYTGDRADLQRKILLAIARGKPGDEGKEQARILEEAFGTPEGSDVPPSNPG